MFQLFASVFKSFQVGCCNTDRQGEKNRRNEEQQPQQRHSDQKKYETLKIRKDFEVESEDHKQPQSPSIFWNNDDGYIEKGDLGIRNGSFDGDEYENRPIQGAQNSEFSQFQISSVKLENPNEQFIDILAPPPEGRYLKQSSPMKLTSSIVKSLDNNQNYQEFLRSRKRQDSNLSETDSQHSDKQQRNIKLWTPDEDRLLIALHNEKGGRWAEIAQEISGRNQSQCSQRWRRIRPQKQRKAWSKSEDDLVVQMVLEKKKNWGEIAAQLPGRTGKQIRERYINQLDPSINQEPWSTAEDDLILKKYYAMGSRWSEISKFLKGRPENMVKNRFYSHLRRLFVNNFDSAQVSNRNSPSYKGSQFNEIDSEIASSEDDVSEQNDLTDNLESINLKLEEESKRRGLYDDEEFYEDGMDLIKNQLNGVQLEEDPIQLRIEDNPLYNSVSPIIVIQEPINPKFNNSVKASQINHQLFTNTFVPINNDIQTYTQPIRQSIYQQQQAYSSIGQQTNGNINGGLYSYPLENGEKFPTLGSQANNFNLYNTQNENNLYYNGGYMNNYPQNQEFPLQQNGLVSSSGSSSLDINNGIQQQQQQPQQYQPQNQTIKYSMSDDQLDILQKRQQLMYERLMGIKNDIQILGNQTTGAGDRNQFKKNY